MFDQTALSLGYDPYANPRDPDPVKAAAGKRHQALIGLAITATNKDLHAADALLRELAGQPVQAFVEQRVAEVRAAGNGAQPPPAPPAAPPKPESETQKWTRLNQAVRDRISGEQIAQ